jgi:hypothetical protein
MNDTNSPAPGPGPAQGDGHLTHAQRQALARSFQAQAARRRDPLAANIGVITGDLMAIAHGVAAAVEVRLADGPGAAEAGRPLAQSIELYLRIVRQLDHNAKLERAPTPPPQPDAATER